MRYMVTLLNKVDFAPDSEAAEVLQNVRTILSTRIGSVPLHRDFGVTWEHIDKPLPVAMPLQIAAIIEAIQEFEPRAKVERVDFENSNVDAMDGVLIPRVLISLGDEEED